MIKYLTITLLVVASASQAQTVLLDENFTSGIPETWALFNEDGLTPAAEVSDFTDAWIGTVAGPDTAAASTSFYDPTGQANDYLITPKISIGNFSKIVWSARSVDASYPDGYEVLISTTDSLPASFTDTLMSVGAEAAYFSRRGVELDVEGYANQDVFIAFQNNTSNGYILLIDDVKVLNAETASIQSSSIASTISVFPNPTADLLNISADQKIISATVYSAAGQQLITGQSNQLDVSSLNNGLYFIQIETIAGIETIQFSKK